jgi:hypothetical protein
MSTPMKDMDSYLAAVPKENEDGIGAASQDDQVGCPRGGGDRQLWVPMFKLHGSLFRLPL